MNLRDRKILFLGDDPVLLRYFLALFPEDHVLTAYDEAEGMRVLAGHPALRVMVADLEVAGESLIERCRAAYPLVEQIVLTRVPVGAREPADGLRYLTKPFQEADLLEAVRQALEAPGRDGRVRGGAPAGGAPDVTTAEKLAHMEALNRLKDELVLIAAHDIRAPLSVILGYAEMLLDSEPTLTPSGKQAVQRIRVTARRLMTMVNNVLNLSAIEEGKVGLILAPARVSDMVGAVLEGLSGLAAENQVACSFTPGGGDGPYDLDHTKVEQVLQNLVSNAVKFNRKGGSVRVTAEGRPERIVFTVEDTGRGFTEEEAGRAFTKFAHFTGATAGGSGLGLAIARAFVRLHGGEIELESRPGQGSTFRFTIVPGFRPGRTGGMLSP